ncbi:MAG TPA: hypothetical protein VGT03_07460 [Candidatus Acidoferrales bacterium]|nr:hypothetical protein [Candidatus Acidoferrales bacterium]
MPRMNGVDEKHAPLTVRIIYWLARRRLRNVPEGMKVRAYDPRLLRNCVRMDLYTEAKGTVPPRLKRLAMLKTAMLVGCPF